MVTFIRPSRGRAQATPGEQNGQPCQAAKCGKIFNEPGAVLPTFQASAVCSNQAGRGRACVTALPLKSGRHLVPSPRVRPYRELKTTRAPSEALRPWRNTPTRRAVLRASDTQTYVRVIPPVSQDRPGEQSRGARASWGKPGAPKPRGAPSRPPRAESLPKTRFERDAPSHRPTRVTSGKTVGSSRGSWVRVPPDRRNTRNPTLGAGLRLLDVASDHLSHIGTLGRGLYASLRRCRP
jgi:hypothetical protein